MTAVNLEACTTILPPHPQYGPRVLHARRDNGQDVGCALLNEDFHERRDSRCVEGQYRVFVWGEGFVTYAETRTSAEEILRGY